MNFVAASILMLNFLLIEGDRVSSLLSTMSTVDKISQMAQVVITLILTSDNEPDLDRIEYYFGQLGVGSLLVVPPANGDYLSAQQYRSIVATIQDVATTYDRPPVIVGIDSVHGANYIAGAIMTPQQINLASTWNTSCAEQAGYLASRDTRAAGMTWLFSPILGLGIQPYWARMYETFGEMKYIMCHLVSSNSSSNLLYIHSFRGRSSFSRNYGSSNG